MKTSSFSLRVMRRRRLSLTIVNSIISHRLIFNLIRLEISRPSCCSFVSLSSLKDVVSFKLDTESKCIQFIKQMLIDYSSIKVENIFEDQDIRLCVFGVNMKIKAREELILNKNNEESRRIKSLMLFTAFRSEQSEEICMFRSTLQHQQWQHCSTNGGSPVPSQYSWLADTVVL
ncbi:hypothetical protein V1478_009339 [Vespula squamosa]|uniref:Uncharacterized protein n=1 Tax=Vespula squamosa TaxID=30214 RepID=A0ABD2APC3_VESSQ